MTESEFAVFCERAIPEYAAEKVLSGTWELNEALEKSSRAYAELLPDGLATKNHYLQTIRDLETGESLGVIWLADDRANYPQSGFIYELYVDENRRGKGVAQAAMLALEKIAREMGLRTLRLHVFGQNRIARSLYEKLGYEITDINMAKTLE